MADSYGWELRKPGGSRVILHSLLMCRCGGRCNRRFHCQKEPTENTMVMRAVTIETGEANRGMAGTIVLGIGNRLNGDDAAGALVVEILNRALRAPGATKPGLKPCPPDITAIDAGTAPESYTSVIRRSQPDVLILVDAADMGLPAGSLRIIPRERIDATSLSTHSLPLSAFMFFAEELSRRVLLVGVQPEHAEIGRQVSKAVRKSARELAQLILKGRVAQLPVLE